MTNHASVRITGVGAEIPADVITSAEVEQRAALCQRFHLEPGWLEHVTGVQTRCWAPSHVQPSEPLHALAPSTAG
jgi:3-oxoacyl-[acyl-carrier-protein] synthase III